jgi:hypothetical protein
VFALIAVVLMAKPTLTDELVKQHGEEQRPRIERGLKQVQALWKKEDGDLAAFVKQHFISDPKQL